jgi:hypothetical protein
MRGTAVGLVAGRLPCSRNPRTLMFTCLRTGNHAGAAVPSWAADALGSGNPVAPVPYESVPVPTHALTCASAASTGDL